MLNHRHHTRRFLVGLSLSSAVLLAGCSDDNIAEPELHPVESSEENTDEATSSTTVTTIFETETEEEQAEEEPKGREECVTNSASPEIHKATAEVNE